MSEQQGEESAAERSGTTWDAPNQQVVREDQSAPWDEGTGGTPGTPETQASSDASEETTETEEAEDLDAMTKDELLDYARSIGASPANASMTKDELRDAIDEVEGQ